MEIYASESVSEGIPSRKVGAHAVLAVTTHWLASNVDSISGSRWNVDGAWHAASVQLLKLSLMVSWDRTLVEGMCCKV